MSKDQERLTQLIEAAKRAGADRADALFVASRSVSAMCRRGVPEGLEHSETIQLGLRVFIGNRAASVSATALEPSRFAALAEQAVAMAHVVPEDAFTSQVDPARQGIYDIAALDLVDPDTAPSLETLLQRAREAEEIALAFPGITNSNGASASYGKVDIALAESSGFSGHYTQTSHSHGISVLAGDGPTMQRDYAGHSARHLSDLESAESLGREAAERVLARMNPVKPRTGTFPVVFDRRVSGSLLGHLAGAINGASIARGTSFLSAHKGKRILPAALSVIDDPTRRRGLRSKPFDAEGFLPSPFAFVQEGVLQDWILDSRSAKQLNLSNNGRASRGVGGPPSPSVSNFFLTGGIGSREALLSDISEGIYVTEMMGSSINGLTGDYSRGASGFMIRNGELAEPVAELTIAGNLIDMFASLRAADDLEYRHGVDAPTLRIDTMSVAGS
ncbi:TldD/PmbA family protein [Asaia astilbis]|uniref:TldD/PmbA family protein n=1 Tax=Asaia astilbis TaxID=610244 RepID=UPI00047223FB|nr:TldD/PmbA family protein [Asaia astilbis]